MALLKINIFASIFIILCTNTSVASTFNFREFDDKIRCVPEIPYYDYSVVSAEEFADAIDTCSTKLLEANTNLSLLNKDTKVSFSEIFNSDKFYPFTVKKVISKKSTLYFWGDLHGSAHAFSRSLRTLISSDIIDTFGKIKHKHTYFVFLGDFVDRGKYGTEVLFLISKLYLQNPHQVLIVRGNHEDININTQLNGTCFYGELINKFGTDKATSLLKKVASFYKMLPAALYIGYAQKNSKTAFIQACHGGMELGYNPCQLLESAASAEIITKIDRFDELFKLPDFTRKQIVNKIPSYARSNYKNPQTIYQANLGLMWNDFCENDSSILEFTRGRGWKYGKLLTQDLLALQSSQSVVIDLIIRGHQHYGTLLKRMIEEGGMTKLYDGLVQTIFSAPAIIKIENQASAFLKLKIPGIQQ